MICLIEFKFISINFVYRELFGKNHHLQHQGHNVSIPYILF